MSRDLMTLPGAVVVGPSMLPVLRLLCEAAIRSNRRNGGQSTRQLMDLHNAVVVAQVAHQRHNDSPTEVLPHDEYVIDPTSYLTVAQVADRLGCSRRTAQRKARQLGAVKRGGVWLTPTETVEEHLVGTTTAKEA